MCAGKRALLRWPVPHEMGAHAVSGVTREVSALLGSPHLGRGLDPALLSHLLHQKRGQCSAALEGVEDSGWRRLGRTGKGERGGCTEAEEDLSGRGTMLSLPCL